MKKRLFIGLCIALVLVFATQTINVRASNGGLKLYGTIGSYLVEVDPDTGDASEVAMLSGPIDSVGPLAFDPNTGILYTIARAGGNHKPRLAKIDRCTGEVTVIGQITLPGSIVYFAEGLAIHSDGTIYVSMSINGDFNPGSDYYSETLATVDPDTAVATQLATITGTVQKEADGLEFVGETLYATDDPGSGPTNIYTLNIGTGVATYKGTLSNPRFNNVNDMAYNFTSGLFGFDPGAYTNGHPRYLCTISTPGTATATAIGITHTAAEFGSELMRGLAWASDACCPPFVADLWAGAGQNDTTKGTKVGTVTVTNDGENIYVTYEITESECYLTEVHAYVGKNPLTTAAPGQFPFKKEFEESEGYPTEYTFEISISEELDAGCEDMLFVAAHAEVCCGEGEGTYTFVQGDIATVTLWAGQTIDSGTVTVAIDGENLVVTYETKDGWELTETQLYAGTTRPLTAAPGQFPYKHSPLEPPVTTDVYTIPLSELEVGCDDTLYLAAHATVQKDLGGEYQTETGWGQGEQIDGGWAMYFWVTIPCEVVVEPECETAWGYGDDTLESLLITKKWGWYFLYPICCY